jgi:type I restriction enzyme S subunit
MRDGEKFRLGDLCSITKGETPIKQAVPGRYPLVVTAAERNTHKTFQFDCRAVIVPLVSSTGHGHASIKRIHFQEGKFALGSILCAVVPKDEKRLNAEFLHVYFSYFKDQLIVPLMKGSANVSLSVSTLAELKIIVPPMDVQMRVIRLSKNDALMKPLEDELTHQETLLAQLQQAILQEAIQGKLTADWRAAHPDVEPASQLLYRIQTEKARLIAAKKLRKEKPLPKVTPAEIPFEIPKSWEWCRLGNILNFSSGDGLTAAQMTGGDIPVFGGNGINGYHNKANTEIETILVGRVGANCGAVHKTPAKAWVTDNAFITTFSKNCLTMDFLVLLLRFLNLNHLSYDGSQPVISGRRVYPLPTPLPPMAEQAAIVERVETLMAICRALEAEIEHSRTHSSLLLQAVLKAAFSKAS